MFYETFEKRNKNKMYFSSAVVVSGRNKKRAKNYWEAEYRWRRWQPVKQASKK
jgi:hypothetical protein